MSARGFHFFDRIERKGGVSVGAPRAHLGCDPNRFHDLFRRRPVTQRRLGMAANAPSASLAVQSFTLL